MYIVGCVKPNIKIQYSEILIPFKVKFIEIFNDESFLLDYFAAKF